MDEERDKTIRKWLRFSLRTLLLFVLVLCMPLAWLMAKVREGGQHEQRLRQMVNDYNERWTRVPIMEPAFSKAAEADKAEIYKFCQDHAFTLRLNSLVDDDAIYQVWSLDP